MHRLNHRWIRVGVIRKEEVDISYCDIEIEVDNPTNLQHAKQIQHTSQTVSIG